MADTVLALQYYVRHSIAILQGNQHYMYVPLLVSGPLLLVLRVDRKLIPPIRPRNGREKGMEGRS
jgi:hypothetical protein